MRISGAGSNLGSVTSTTAVEVVPAPGSAVSPRTRRFVKLMTFTNAGATTRIVTIRYKDTDASGATFTGRIFTGQVAAQQSWSFPQLGQEVVIDKRTRSIEVLLDASGSVEFTASWEDRIP